MKPVNPTDWWTGGADYQTAIEAWFDRHGINMGEVTSYEVLDEGMARVALVVRDAAGKLQVDADDQVVTREVIIESNVMPPFPPQGTWLLEV